MAARLCSQCGGALDLGRPTCPWCGTPVPKPPPVQVVYRTDPELDLDDGTDPVAEGRAALVSGGVLLAFALLCLIYAGFRDSGCGTDGSCEAGSVVVAILGLAFLGLSIGCFLGTIHLRRRGDF
jgi:hypothetical protein